LQPSFRSQLPLQQSESEKQSLARGLHVWLPLEPLEPLEPWLVLSPPLEPVQFSQKPFEQFFASFSHDDSSGLQQDSSLFFAPVQ